MAMFEDIERRAIERMIIQNPDRHSRDFKEETRNLIRQKMDLGHSHSLKDMIASKSPVA
jgi:hypothetical protein